MAGSISDYLEDAILDHALGVSAYTYTSLYIGLSTANPTDDASGIAEPSGNNYARELCTGSGSWDAAASRKTTNTAAVEFNQASGPWGTITHWFVCTHLTNVTWGTNVELIAHGELANNKVVVNGNTPSIAASEMDITFSASGSAGGMNDYLVHKMIDKIFRDQAYVAQTLYLGLCTGSQPTDAGVYTECADSGSYAREQITSAWDASSGGHSSNTSAITFSPNPTGTWGSVTYSIITDSATRESGHVLFNGQVTTQTPNTGDTVQYAAGDFDITIT